MPPKDPLRVTNTANCGLSAEELANVGSTKTGQIIGGGLLALSVGGVGLVWYSRRRRRAMRSNLEDTLARYRPLGDLEEHYLPNAGIDTERLPLRAL